MTSNTQTPKQDWLNIVTTSKARTKIRQALSLIHICVTDHETRKDKEEIHGKITVVESLDIATTGKSISLEYMIPYHHKRCV